MSENIEDKELERDLRNLHIPEEDQHIPFVEIDDMDCYSDEAKQEFKQMIEEEKKKSQ